MTTKALVVTIVGAGTIAAAGAGSYLATRLGSDSLAAQPDTVVAAETQAPAVSAAPTDAATAATTVAVDPAPPPPAPAPEVRTPAETAPPPPARVATIPRRTEPKRDVPPASTPKSEPAAPPAAPITAPVVEVPPPTPPPAGPPVAQEPTKTRFEEIVVAEDSVIGIRLDSPISSETAKVEDKVTARVSRDLNVNGRTAIPAGSRLEGTVTLVDRGGKFREQSRLGIRFTSLVIGDTRVPIDTDAILRNGESPAKESTSKIGASAVVGAILGAVVGGKKGAVIGGTAGAAGGTAAVMASGRNDVTLPAGTPLTVRLSSPVTVLIERNDRQ